MHFSHVIGLDQEENVLRIVQVRRRILRPEVRNAYRLLLPADAAEARLFLERFAQTQNIRRIPCVLGLPTETTLLRLLDLPPAAHKPQSRRIQERIEPLRSLPADAAVEESKLLRSPTIGLRLLVGLTRRDALDELLKLPEAVGMNAVCAVPMPLAAFNVAAALWPRRRGGFLAVHLRREKTLVSAGCGKELLQLWSFPIGTDVLLSPGDAATSAQDTAERWCLETQACLRQYESDSGVVPHPIRTLLLSGSQPIPEELCRALEKKTGRRVLRLEETPRGQRVPELGRFSCAYGLALSGMAGAAATLSLIPPDLKERLILRWQFRYWLGTAAAVLLALGAVAGTLRRNLDRNTLAFEQTRSQLQESQALDSRLREVTARNRELREQLRPLAASVRKGAIVREVMAAVSEAKHGDDWISLFADGPSYFTNRGVPAATPPEGRDGERRERDMLPIEHLVVEGYTPSSDFSTIRALIETLRNHPLIASVDLLGDDKVVEDDERDRRWSFTGARRFALEIKINGLGRK